jgi:hypothetical protein
MKDNETGQTEPEKSAEARREEIGLRVDNCTAYFRGFPVREMLAFPTGVAIRLLGITAPTFRREVSRGKIRRTSLKLVGRAELLRYLEADSAPQIKIKKH